ncbi:MAG TPA: hypothetical protein VHZ30_00060 [Verrucomicrobiae bacterium]|nr:hypothetical protein [Verrucomicrobiae bacterium]
MKTETVEIPTGVLSSVETLDELQDWLTAHNPKVMSELRDARREDKTGKFKPWKPRYMPWPTGSK